MVEATRKPRRILLKVLAALVVAVAAGITVNFIVTAWRLSRPDMGFESYTGLKLPSGVIPIGHVTRMEDNLLHTSHFWLLDGRQQDFRALAELAGLERSDADAKDALGDRDDLFDGTRLEFLEGYEGSLDGGRDHWLVIYYPGNRAVFEY